VYWPPSQFEAAFVSTEHNAQTLATTLSAAGHAFKAVRAHSLTE
jgi:glutamate-1-semialdehyde aminotransferase